MAVLLELADIGTRHERLVAGAGQNHHAHLFVLAQFDERLTHALPHLDRHGVAFFGIVEGDDADPVGDALEDFAFGKGFLVFCGGIEHGKPSGGGV